MAASGNPVGGERMLWSQFLENPSSRTARWGLWELYASRPVVRTVAEEGFAKAAPAFSPEPGVPGRVALQLVVLTGSLDERPEELGIAHYTEHLAFGGSKNFKAEDMVSLFQRLGVEYGSDVNAVTTFDYTAYRLDFRENDSALLHEGLRLFRDFGDGLTFEPAIIERERRNLQRACALLDCLRVASMYDDEEGIEPGDVAYVVRGLVSSAVNALDCVELRKAAREHPPEPP